MLHGSSLSDYAVWLEACLQLDGVPVKAKKRWQQD